MSEEKRPFDYLGDNYLEDAINRVYKLDKGIVFKSKEQYKICANSCINCKVRSTIADKCYQDPDTDSEMLYDHLSKIFSNPKSEFGKKYSLKFVKRRSKLYLRWSSQVGGNKEWELSVDYIGPSRNVIKNFFGEDKVENAAGEIGEFLLFSRTIGGHVFWPAHQVGSMHTINQARGYGAIDDRIDITLAELQHFYATEGEGNGKYCHKLYEAFGRYKEFFECFKSFENYIKYMMLENFVDFVDKNKCEVISLTDSVFGEKSKYIKDIKDYKCKLTEDNFKKYIKNCTDRIKKRSEKMIVYK